MEKITDTFKGHSVWEIIVSSINEIKMALYGIFLFLDINVHTIEMLTYLMLIDSFMGVVKVFRIEPRDFSFKELLIGMASKYALLFIPLSIAIMAKSLEMNWNMMLDWFLKIMCVSEGISILGNGISIKTRKDVKDFDLITKLFKVVREMFISLGEEMLKRLKGK